MLLVPTSFLGLYVTVSWQKQRAMRLGKARMGNLPLTLVEVCLVEGGRNEDKRLKREEKEALEGM